uniref:Expansin-like EG45 domain-containing protein n=1 Tax=Oryza punctata TaxID=4537 RepID=A0A0E0LEX6_ORYPU
MAFRLAAAALLLGIVSVSHAIEGTATFYTTYNPSACYGNQDNGRMIAAAGDGLWNGGKICGKMFTVRCVGGTNAVPKCPTHATAAPSPSRSSTVVPAAPPPSTSPGRPSPPLPPRRRQGRRRLPTVPSACYGLQDQGTMIAAASDGLWDGGRAGGRMYTVRCVRGTNAVPNPCNGGTVTVKIVDRCPSPGCTSTLDLSREAFAAIANLDAGRIVIDYNQV